MTWGEILLIAVGLSMDAVAVSMTNGMVYNGMKKSLQLMQPLAFGGFQALMPLLGGLLAGGILANAVTRFSGIVILGILGIIGIKMLKDGIASLREEVCIRPEMNGKLILIQSIATSLDAFAVGIALKLAGAPLLEAALVFGVTTFILVIFAIIIGKKFGDYLGCRAEILGGAILLLIGLKAIL
jgi:putative Mn2+ efflux pump MntP